MSTPASSTVQKWALGLCFGAMGAMMLGVVLFDLLVPNGNESSSSSAVSRATNSKAPTTARDVTSKTEASAPKQTTRPQSPKAPERKLARSVGTLPTSQIEEDHLTNTVATTSELSKSKISPTAVRAFEPSLRMPGLSRSILNQHGSRSGTLIPNVTAIASEKAKARAESE